MSSPEVLKRHGHEHKRHGIMDLFAARAPRAGMIVGICRRRHRPTEYRALLDLVLDNTATHKPCGGW